MSGISSFNQVILLVLLPAAGTIIGVLLAESVRVASRFVGASLHCAAGIAIGVISIELIPLGVESVPPYLFIGSFCAGAALSVAIARTVSHVRSKVNGTGSNAVLMVYVAVGSDLLVDGIMIGIGSAVSSRLGFLLGVSQIVGNIPGGFAAIANASEHETSRRTRLGMAVASLIPLVAGAVGGYWLLKDLDDWLKHATLIFAAGILLLATIEDVVPQADQPEASRWLTTVWFAAGFALFAALALYVD